MKRPRFRLGYAVIAVAGCTVAATAPFGASLAQAGAPGPSVHLIAAQNTITVPRFGREVFLDPGIYVESLGSALQFNVQRVSYAKPVTITQAIRLPGGGTEFRSLPASLLDGLAGLRDFLRVSVTNAKGKVVAAQRATFCPDVFDPQRATPGSPATSPYPLFGCESDPFQLATAWGVQKGWGVDPFEFSNQPYRLRLGTYKVTVTITSKYRHLLNISAAAATAHVKAIVVKATGCCEAPGRRNGRSGTLPRLPKAASMQNPPRDALPDLVPAPSWGISVSHTRATKKRRARDELDFGATVWIGGNSPLDVEGFRANGSPTMKAFQYFFRNGHVIGRTRAGTMGFDTRNGHNHWHFEQFARYSLLDSAKSVALRSHKQGFCIAPTDGVNLLLPHAVWQPQFFGFGGACGSPTALWVQEQLPVGWGDTYFQSVAGQAFNITHVPNGTYYIEVVANPKKLLHETNVGNDVSLRKVILGGTRGHRTVRVPAFHGIDPEG
jgi:Lysyl oxidase